MFLEWLRTLFEPKIVRILLRRTKEENINWVLVDASVDQRTYNVLDGGLRFTLRRHLGYAGDILYSLHVVGNKAEKRYDIGPALWEEVVSRENYDQVHDRVLKHQIKQYCDENNYQTPPSTTTDVDPT